MTIRAEFTQKMQLTSTGSNNKSLLSQAILLDKSASHIYFLYVSNNVSAKWKNKNIKYKYKVSTLATYTETTLNCFVVRFFTLIYY